MISQDSNGGNNFESNYLNMILNGYVPTLRNKCTECHTMNPIDAKFCRCCGSNRIELFLDYTIYDERKGFNLF